MTLGVHSLGDESLCVPASVLILYHGEGSPFASPAAQMVYGRTPFADLPFIPKMNAICNPQVNDLTICNPQVNDLALCNPLQVTHASGTPSPTRALTSSFLCPNSRSYPLSICILLYPLSPFIPPKSLCPLLPVISSYLAFPAVFILQHRIQFGPCVNPAAIDSMRRCLDRDAMTRASIQVCAMGVGPGRV